MKTKILSLLTAFIALGFTAVYGQAINGSAPRGINCADSPIFPIAGKEYTYQAASNQPGDYTFWATKNKNFITTSGGITTTNIATMLTTPDSLLTASSNYGVSNAADNVKITWSDEILSRTTISSPTFVAVNKEGSCANNFKVWAITPIKAFTVDIRNYDSVAAAAKNYDVSIAQCLDVVRGATYNSLISKMEYDYGKQVLYFEVIAANFTSTYTPTFQVSGLGNGQTATIQWDIHPDFSSPTTAVAIANGTPVSTSAVSTSVTNTSIGVSIYVRLIIQNKTFEGIAPTNVTLAVDGKNSVGDWDIDNWDGTQTTCVQTIGADQKDIAVQTLNPRPTVNSADPINAPLAPGNSTN